MSETKPADPAVQAWPGVMNNRTVWLYLDCPTPHYRRAMKRLLLAGGYKGFKNRERFHRKDLIDAALGIGPEVKTNATKKQMMEAAKQ